MGNLTFRPEEIQEEKSPITMSEIPEEKPKPSEETPLIQDYEESYQDKVKRNYEYYFAMFDGGGKPPTGNRSYEQYLEWRHWKQEYERLFT